MTAVLSYDFLRILGPVSVCGFVVVVCLFWLFWVFIAAHRLFSICGEWDLLFIAAHRLLIVVARLVAERGLWAHGLQ